MRKISLFVRCSLLELLFVIPVISCGDDNDDPITPEDPTETVIQSNDGKIIPVPGDNSNFDYLYDFFNKELPLTSWSGYNSPFLLDNSETCYFINSYDELQSFYTGKEKLPSIDFDSYTLIIGQKPSSNVYQNLDKQAFYERDGRTFLDLFFSGDIVLPTLVYFNYWGLYPKMSKRDINVNIILKEYE